MIVLKLPPPSLMKAASVYCNLLNAGLSVDRALKLTTDMLSLSKLYQRALRRAVHPLSFVIDSIGKRLLSHEAAGLEIAIDGFNVLHTIEAAIRREPLYLSSDLMLRDILGVHGKIRMGRDLITAIRLMLSSLGKFKVKEVYFFFDKPVSKSGDLARHIESMMRSLGIRGEAKAISHVDKAVSEFPVAASSDTIVIASAHHILDLPMEILSLTPTPIYAFPLVPKSSSQVSPSSSPTSF